MYRDSLDQPLSSYNQKIVHAILGQPSFGGIVATCNETNFPCKTLEPKESADLFPDFNVIHLLKDGRAGIVLPGWFALR
jgi:type I restriction enzyme M protein